MIKYVNEELFNVVTTKEKGKFGEYFLTSINSIVKEAVRGRDEMKQRQVLSVIHSSENLNENMTRIQVDQNEGYGQKLKVNQTDRNKFDTDLFLIAIPFSGIMQPMGESYDYRIYRAFVSKAESYSIEHGDRKFNKIAYMIVTVNKTLFKEENKHYKDTLVLEFASYRIRNQGKEDQQTLKDIVKIQFTKNGNINQVCSTEECDPINVEDFKDQKPFIIFNPGERTVKEEDSTADESCDKEDSKDESEKGKKQRYNNHPGKKGGRPSSKEVAASPVGTSRKGLHPSYNTLHDDDLEVAYTKSDGPDKNLGDMIEQMYKDAADKKPKRKDSRKSKKRK